MNIYYKIKTNKQFKIYNLDQKFNNIIHTNLLSKVIIDIIKNKKQVNHEYLLGSKRPIKISKIIEILSKKLKKKPKYSVINSKKTNFTLSLEKAINEKVELWSTIKTLKSI